MKFIHTSNLNLDTPFEDIQIEDKNILERVRESTFFAFREIINMAIKQNVDFVIISGDIYNSDAQSVTAQLFFVNQLNKLKEAGIPVYIAFGDQDYNQIHNNAYQFPDNVFIFPTELRSFYHTTRDGIKVELAGMSYKDRLESRNIATLYPSKHSDIDYMIGVLHGAQKTGENDNYAPFTKKELIDKNYNYWALGHSNKRKVINEDPYIVYPGDSQGVNLKEDGSKGFYLVEYFDKKTNISFLPSEIIKWNKIEINGNSLNSMSDIKREIKLSINELMKNVSHFVSVTITNADKLPLAVIKSIEDDSFVNGIAAEQFEGNFIFIIKVKVKMKDNNIFSKSDKEFWENSAMKIFSNREILNTIPSVKNYPLLQRLISDPDFIDSLKEETFELINERKNECN